jgi:RNA polymerase sigma-70 factor (ECF subfamily)
MTPSEEDRVFISQVALGNKDAMRRLFERHHDALFGFIKARSGDAALAADVTQEAMLELWRSASNFRGGSSVKTWLFTIARNKLVDSNRRSARVSYTDDLPDEVDEAPNPEAILASAQEAGRVRACLQTLKDAQRTIMRLAFFEGLTYGEIAQVEGIPTGTVKTRILHAKRALLRCLGGR